MQWWLFTAPTTSATIALRLGRGAATTVSPAKFHTISLDVGC